ncbi:MAG: hypothetical protein IJT88_02550 [Kiritimatiellae bacterium]|nr:hypothetical protein [Kiritimatiellia bacterium]
MSLTALDRARAAHLLDEKNAVLVSWDVLLFRAAGSDAPPVEVPRMTRGWQNIPDSQRAILEEYLREQKTVTDPLADREPRRGTWRVLRVFSSRTRTNPDEQGIYQTMICWPDDAGFRSGAYCTEASYVHHEDSYQFWQAAELPNDFAHIQDAGHIYHVNGSLDPETGLWSGQVTADHARRNLVYSWWQKDALAWRKTTRLENVLGLPAGSPGAEDADHAPGDTGYEPNVPDSVLLAASAAATSPTGETAPTGTNGYLLQVTADLNQYGLYNITIIESWAIPFTRDFTRTNAHYTETETVFRNQASVSPSTSGSSIVTRINASFNEFGLFDGSYAVATPKAWRHSYQRENAHYTETETVFGNQASVSPSASGSSIVTRINASYNEFGLFDGSYAVATPKAWQHEYTRPTALYTAHEVVFGNQSSVPTSSGAHHVITSINANYNEFGLFDGVIVWSVPITWEEEFTRTTATYVEHEAVYRNSVTPYSGSFNSTATGATIIRRNTTLNEYGLYDGNLVWLTPVTSGGGYLTKPGGQTGRTSDSYDTTTFYYNVPAASLAGLLGTGYTAAGTEISSRLSLNEMGLFDVVQTVTTFKKHRNYYYRTREGKKYWTRVNSNGPQLVWYWHVFTHFVSWFDSQEEALNAFDSATGLYSNFIPTAFSLGLDRGGYWRLEYTQENVSGTEPPAVRS